MQSSEVPRAVAAATAIASSQGLAVDEAIVLHDSNKLTLRLLPCDVVARVAPAAHQDARFEIDLAAQLIAGGCPVAAPEPRVESRAYERGEFLVTLWTHYASRAQGEVPPAEYADALERLHAGMRQVDVPVPRFVDRVESAQELVASRARTPALVDADRELLSDTLGDLSRRCDQGAHHQLLHGEPHPGNLLATEHGPVFVDLETCCRGPVEFDLAHAPESVSQHYPDLDHQLLQACRVLVLAMITTWRWDREDQLPNGRQLGIEWLTQLRASRTHEQ